MSIDSDKPTKIAQQELSRAIHELKQGADGGKVLPSLEVVLAHLESMTKHDPLTGALNRRSLFEMLNSELNRSYRTGHTFSLAVIAIDGFPEIMEKHGRPVAVQVLRQVTDVAQGMLRTLDSFGRTTGHEFAIVMPTTWVEFAIKAIERLRNNIDIVGWDNVLPGLQVTFSTGITPNATGDTADNMMDRAREALERAQAKGPGCVECFEPSLPDFDVSTIK
jgi:diguanylate cyclase